MNNVTVAAIVLSLVFTFVTIISSDALSSCTIDQRISLGKQGYTPDRVDKMCGNEGPSAQESTQESNGALDKFFQSFMDELGKGLGKEMFKGNDTANNAAPAVPSAPYSQSRTATMCTTNYGPCPLQGVPAGSSCYCRAYNGFTAPGIAR